MDVDEVLTRLERAWKSYAGHHAFHNFTKRRLYRPSFQQKRRGVSSDVDGGEETETDEETGAAANAATVSTPTGAKEPTGTSGTKEPTETSAPPPAASSRVKGTINFEWKGERDDSDPIVRSHYRFIEECGCSEPMTLVDHGGVPCVKLTVSGASFMLHQIRHMVGAALLVALGKMPQELLHAAMAPPVRINLPLAPPGTLVLRSADFGKFRRSYDGKPSATERSSGSALRLLDRGVERRDAFERDVLFRGLNAQLQHDDWLGWSESLAMVRFDTAEADEIIRLASEWMERRDEMKRVRAALREGGSNEESVETIAERL